MDMPASLPDRLRICADLWVARNPGLKASLPRLARVVMNDSAFFTRLALQPVARTSTLERFARYLGDAANWEAGHVPDMVRAFVHAVGGSPDDPAASPDIRSGQIGAAAAPTGAAPAGECAQSSPTSAPLTCTLCTRADAEIAACAAIGCPFLASAEAAA